MRLRPWIAACVLASFPVGYRLEPAQDAIAYIDWIDSLPCTSDGAASRDWQDYDPNRWNLH